MTQPKSAANPDPEEIAGRYQVVKRLGAGAFGTVYKAKDKVLGRMLAIKTIRMEGLAATGASIEELMDRFKREAQISAQLRHPNIVTIYDVGESEGTSYLAMEFIDGVGLERVIAAAGRLPLDRAALIAAQVADALDFAHRHNVVHRDIKPANIMIEAGDRVKVTDFGIAKVTDSGDHLTMTGSLLGTPSYMSPEQAKGAALDGRSDLFAVGAILYEMLAGQKAFRGDSITGLIFKIITEEPQLISELEPTLPAEVVQIVQRALHKAPEARYQSGRELAEALLTFTRTGASPTLRQGEIDTMRGGAAAAAAPTVSGQSPTMGANAATQGRAAATEIARPGMMPPAAKPVEATYLVSSGAPQPPAVDPTYLVGSGRMPAPPAPAPYAPPPPPLAPPPSRTPAAQAAAAIPAPPRTARVAEPSGSKTGLIVGVVGAALLLVLVLGGGAAWYFMKDDAAGKQTADAATGGGTTGSTTAGSGSTGATSSGTATTASPAATEPTPAAGAGTTTADAGTGGTATTGSASSQTASTAVQPTGSTAGQATTTGGGSSQASAGQTGGGQTGGGRVPGGDTRVATRAPETDFSVLDQEPPELTGRESGASVAGTYRSENRYGSSGSTYGASGRLRARAKVPQDLTTQEKRAAVVLLNLRGLQEVHKRRAGSYGNFQQVMPVPVASADRFDRAGYRFELKLEDDGFTIMATSMAGRALMVDDTGYVRYVE
ncbi:MAG TPA: serine/threonine-protein kinase [Vicinamibacteria bacterium]|nr:serine/threonine-protein kinase [Vicinamibacteria bacterium]